MGIRTITGLSLIAALVTTMLLRGDGAGVQHSKGPDLEGSVGQGATGGPESKDHPGERLPHRVLPGSVAAVDWLAALGIVPSRIVALPAQVERWSAIRKTPAPWATRPRYERLTSETALGFEPDLVLVSPYSDAAAVQRIQQGAGRVMTVTEPSDWVHLLASGEAIADAVGAGEAYTALAASLEGRKQALADRGAKPLRVLPYANFGGGGTTAGTDTTLNLTLELAGFTNVAMEAGISGAGNMTYEQILALEFDAILVLGEEDRKTSQSADVLVEATTLAGVVPIQSRRFIVLPEALYASGSLTILDSAEEVARQGDKL